MSKLIYVDKLKKDILALRDCYNGFSDTYDKACIIGVIDEQPTIEERKTGTWIHGREIARTMFGDKLMEIDYEGWSCSICGCCCEDWRQKPTYNFCPSCGARMEGGE